MIPDPRKKRRTEGSDRDSWEPEPIDERALPEEPDNVRSPERPKPKKRPPANWADDDPR